ncbi:Kiwa anti-phage protein KwaB-like domain-containing protein [Sodalis sp. RH16]|uniref:Kiwa anti-phage protein KwaB-like domain-containing protein n=1 Tax=Sodalis sp. RH16 TaxID=3394331 RepID=UPI0039B3D02A
MYGFNIVISRHSSAEDEAFVIEKNFDFYATDTSIFMAIKRAFESRMKHRASYSQAFATLQATPNFSTLFTDMTALINYVGNNSIQLRRMARIEERGLYLSPLFTSCAKCQQQACLGIELRHTEW